MSNQKTVNRNKRMAEFAKVDYKIDANGQIDFYPDEDWNDLMIVFHACNVLSRNNFENCDWVGFFGVQQLNNMQLPILDGSIKDIDKFRQSVYLNLDEFIIKSMKLQYNYLANSHS